MSKLRDFVRGVFQAKTPSEERKLIARESAAVRTALRDGKDANRVRNVSKLIYLHLLGEDTDFGQMAVLNLMASDKYHEKKVGYLALSLLVDESSEVLVMVENLMKNDLANGNPCVKSLPLMALANVASEDMAINLGSELDKYLMRSVEHPVGDFIHKKARLAAVRVVRRAPHMAPLFLEKMKGLFAEEGQSALMAGVTLVTECLRQPGGEEYLTEYRGTLPRAKRRLKQLLLPPRSAHYDRRGVADPFLQVQLLRYIRVLCEGCEVSSNLMGDVLQELLTLTREGGKEHNAACGNAVLYEGINTIIAIESTVEQRVTAVIQLGSFLATRKNDLRYVALNALLRLQRKDPERVKEHKNIASECLLDPDLSIRRRAVDLIYHCVDEGNVRRLLSDLVKYLSLPHASSEFKEMLTAKISTAAARYAPTPQWHIDILIKLLTLAGSMVDDGAPNRLVTLISQADQATQAIATCRLWKEISNPLSSSVVENTKMLETAVWCVGEFSDLLVAATGPKSADPNHPSNVQGIPAVEATPQGIATTLNAIMQCTGEASVRQRCLNALFKTAVRFEDVRVLVVPIFESYQASLDLELQQRAWEYLHLLADASETSLKAGDRMPPHEATAADAQGILAADLSTAADAAQAAPSPPKMFVDEETAAPPKPAEHSKSLLDDLWGTEPVKPSGGGGMAQQPSSNSLLDDIFGGTTTSATSASAAPAAPQAQLQDFFSSTPQQQQQQQQQQADFFSQSSSSSPPPPPQQQQFSDPFGMPQASQGYTPEHPVLGQQEVFTDQYIKVVAMLVRPDASKPHVVRIDAVVYNTSSTPLHDLDMLAAVSKAMSLIRIDHVGRGPLTPGKHWVLPIHADNSNNDGGRGGCAVKFRFSYTPASTGKAANTEFLAKLPGTA